MTESLAGAAVPHRAARPAKIAITAMAYLSFRAGTLRANKQPTRHAGNSTHCKKLQKDRRADRSKLPVETLHNAVGQDETEQQVRADHLRRSHLRIIQQEHRAQGAGARGRKPRLHANRKRQPRQPAGVLMRETVVLHARSKRHAGGSGEQYAEKNHNYRAARACAERRPAADRCRSAGRGWRLAGAATDNSQCMCRPAI